jgi:hypothetical protein
MPVPKTSADYLSLADKRRLSGLGSSPKNTKGLTKWRCQDGHEFEACFNNID